MKRIYAFLLSFLLFLFITSPSMAVSRKEVLGTESEKLTIPPTVEGPGYLLPNSPFYFLDSIKQSLRIVFAFSQEQRARVYANIAGERMAELRLMLLKKDEEGIQASLNGIVNSFKKAEQQLNVAKITGRNIENTAKEINDSIKAKQEVLDDLNIKTSGEMSKQIQAAVEGLTETKIKIEEFLNPEDLANEIKYDVDREFSLRLYEASSSAQALKVALEDLKEQRQQAIEQSLQNREEALEQAIEKQNEKIRVQEQTELQIEKRDWEKSLLLEQDLIEQVTANVEKARQAAFKYQNLQSSDH